MSQKACDNTTKLEILDIITDVIDQIVDQIFEGLGVGTELWKLISEISQSFHYYSQLAVSLILPSGYYFTIIS